MPHQFKFIAQATYTKESMSTHRAGRCRCMLLVAMLATVSLTRADLSLDTLVSQALQQNPGLESLQHQVRAATSAQREARAAYYPQLGASVQYLMTDNAPQAFMLQLNQRQLDMQDPSFDPNHPDDTENIQMSLGVQYPLFHRARRPRQRAAQLHTELAGEQVSAARNALIYAVTRGYYQVLEAQAFAAVQEAALKSFQESLRVAKERYQSGAVVRTDVLNLEVQVAQARENLIRAQNGVQVAIAALNATIGTESVPEDGLPEPELQVHEPAWQPISPERRPELTAARLQRDVAQQHIRIAQANQHPRLNLFGSMIWDGESLRDRENSYIAGVALEWNWFDGGSTRARANAARANQASATARMRELDTQLQLESKQAMLRLQEAWQRIQVTSIATQSADEALRITRSLYEEGATDIATLLVAEVARTETQMRATAARYDFLIAQSNAQRVAGLLNEIVRP